MRPGAERGPEGKAQTPSLLMAESTGSRGQALALALHEGQGRASPPPAQSQGQPLGRCLLPERSSSLPLFIAELLVLFIRGFVFLFRSFVPGPCVLCSAGRHVTTEPGLLPLPRAPIPGVMTESPPNTHTQTCTHRRTLTDTYYTRTHACVHMLTQVMPVLVYTHTHSHTRSAVRALSPPPPDSQPLAPHSPLPTNASLSHTNSFLKCVR